MGTQGCKGDEPDGVQENGAFGGGAYSCGATPGDRHAASITPNEAASRPAADFGGVPLDDNSLQLPLARRSDAGEYGQPTPTAPPPPAADMLNSLFSEVYHELRGIARGMLRTSPPNRTLQPTILVHEAYLRLCHTYRHDVVNRRHFFGSAAEAMRRILVENARRRLTLRRGGMWARVPLEELQVASDATPETLIAIDEALEKLARQYPLNAQVVKLIFFGGLTAAEAGEALNLCERTIKRHWAFARAWLYNELGEPE